MVLLLDMSGSMMGLTSDVARLSAVQLLNVLSTNDFFNVLMVGDDVTSFGGCFIGRIRASLENILAMSDVITDANILYGQADFDKALTMAYTELNVRIGVCFCYHMHWDIVTCPPQGRTIKSFV